MRIGQRERASPLFKDEYELEVTCSSDAAMQSYLSGIDCALRLDRPGISELAEAVRLDDEFALAHAALGRQLFTHGYGSESAVHLKRALSLKDRVTEREQDAIVVVERAARSDPKALELAKSHVAAYPQDVFVLAHLLGPFGLLAFSGTQEWCAQNVALLNVTRPSYRSDDWWHMTSGAFFDAEQGQLAAARKHCERAWSISENGNCAHSLAHLHFEVVALDEGRAFINDWVDNYGAQSDMRHHLMWHFALLDIDDGVDMSQIFELYGRELDPNANDPTPLETLCDNASFLWRCHLSGTEIPATVRDELLVYAEANFGTCGFAFADIHRAMATALHPDHEKHSDVMLQFREASLNSGTRVAECVRQFADGFGAFAGQAYADAVTLLEPVLADSVLIGGSNPQRRIVEDTYLEACMRTRQYARAGAVLQARNRKSSVFDAMLLDEIDGGDENRPDNNE